jgi:RNA binding exosome subunit
MISPFTPVARRFHELKVESFVQATEDEARVMVAIRNLVGTRGELERIEIEGVHSNPLIMLTVKVHREREILEVLEIITKMEFWDKAMAGMDDRLDDDQVFHVRVDKSSTYLGIPVLWDGGEAIELKLKIATYPTSRNDAIKVLKELRNPDFT